MKVFVLKKEDDIEDKQRVEKRDTIHIKKMEKFNYIVINNPKDSNNICTIKEIKLLNQNVPNKICLMGGEESAYEEKEDSAVTDKIGVFIIETKQDKNNDYDNLEIERNNLLQNEECNMLKDLILIMLPKGSLFIKLDREVNDLYMNINWISEKIN